MSKDQVREVYSKPWGDFALLDEYAYSVIANHLVRNFKNFCKTFQLTEEESSHILSNIKGAIFREVAIQAPQYAVQVNRKLESYFKRIEKSIYKSSEDKKSESMFELQGDGSSSDTIAVKKTWQEWANNKLDMTNQKHAK